MGTTPRPASTRVNDFNIIAARDLLSRAAGVTDGLLAAPARWLRVVGWLVLALRVAGDMGLVELVRGAAGGELHDACLCLAGAASAEGFDVHWEWGGGLAAG